MALKAPVVGVLAAFALLAGGIIAWQMLDREEANEEGHHTGPSLEWTEVDPGFTSEYVGFLESLGDGRVIVTTTDYDDSGWIVTRRRVLVTVNGVDWTEVPMPAGVSPFTYDLSGDRWIVAGYGIPDGPGGIINPPGAANEELEVTDTWDPPRQQVFFSDDQGANWVELQINYSWDRQDVPDYDDDNAPLITVALSSGDHMVVVMQSENNEEVLVDGTPGDSGGWEVTTNENPLAQVFASDGGMFEEVAAYEGWISGFPIAASLSTPDGFSLGLLRDVNGRHQSVELKSPDGRNWSEVALSELWPSRSKAVGPDGSLWSTTRDGNEIRIRRADHEGVQSVATVPSNLMVFALTAGPSGVAITANETIMLSGRVEKDGYELRFNEPEGGMTLWDLSAGNAVYEFGLEAFMEGLPEGVREIEQPVDEEHTNEVVLVFEDPETGTELVSFTEEDVLPISPLDPDGDEFQPEMWVGWSADGVDWGWQTLADAFGDEAFGIEDAWVELAVGDGFVLAKVEHYPEISSSPDADGYPSRTTRWFIARVP